MTSIEDFPKVDMSKLEVTLTAEAVRRSFKWLLKSSKRWGLSSFVRRRNARR